MKQSIFSFVMAACVCASPVWAGNVTLLGSGKKAIIIVPASVMEPDVRFHPTAGGQPQNLLEMQRRGLRESTKDMSQLLKKITGQPVEIFTEGQMAPAPEPKPGESPAEVYKPVDAAAMQGATPIYIGAAAQKVFGNVGKTFDYKQAFRYVINAQKGVGLYGESDLASCYAIYELFDRLGCRWFTPGELGECLPTLKDITLEETSVALAPSTSTRMVTWGDGNYMRRNRLGGRPVVASHGLEGYVTKEQREAHPEWTALQDGRPIPPRLRWSNAEMAKAMAANIIAMLDKNPSLTVTLGPNDGAMFGNSPDDLALDAGDWDTTLDSPSITDRLIVLCNRIIPPVLEKHPDVLFGVLAYVQYTRPPVREVPHKRLAFQLAPISYDRGHPIADFKAPHNKELHEIIEGWGKKTKLLSYYAYGYHLAEITAPCPNIAKWSSDLQLIYKNNCVFWQPETLPTYETNMHNMHLGNRLAWDTSRDPAEIIAELHRVFYGNAEKEMAAYWHYVDDVWTQTEEYTGGDFGYLKRFTPEHLKKMRELMNAGIAAAKTQKEKDRVEFANESLKQLEIYMKARRDYAAGNFATVDADYKKWQSEATRLGEKYLDVGAFGMRGKGTSYALIWNDIARKASYEDTVRIHKECNLLTKPLIFKYLPDPISSQDPKNKRDLLAEGIKAGYDKPAFDDSAWKETDPGVETWSMLDLFKHFTGVWYRTTVDLKDLPAGKKIFLWIGGTDGSAEPWVNGKKVTYVNPKGETTDKDGKPLSFYGYCTPVSFDITSLVQKGENKITIYSDRKFVNEIGTGGLMGPVLLYSEK